MNKPKKILMACCNFWHTPFQVGSHQLARGFIKAGWQVGFVSDPVSPLHLLGSRDPAIRERLALHRSKGEWLEDGRLWTYVPGALFTPHNKPLLRSPWAHRNWQRFTLPGLAGHIRRNGFGEVDLLYVDSVFLSYLRNSISHRHSVFRVADLLSGFDRTTPVMEQMERELASSVDMVIYSATNLAGHVNAMSPRRTMHLPNGVNYAHFQRPPGPEPAELAAIPRPRAIYVGAIYEWFDFDLMNRAAAALPDVSFVMIGNTETARRRLEPRPNLHLLGPRPYAQLPDYLYRCDMGIIPFNATGYRELIENVNPLKLLEYMACGLPVVSIRWKELERLASPAVLCDSPEEFVGAIGKLAADGAPADSAPAEKLKAYARGHDWQSRVEALLAGLGLN